MIDRRALAPLLAAGLVLAAVPVFAADAEGLEGVGDDMGYRMFGDAKKNRTILLQNSRPHAIEVFDEPRGVFVAIPPYSDLEVACRGKSRRINVRYRDDFREDIPFQVVVACGRELQFIAPQQVAAPRPETSPVPDVAPVPETTVDAPDASPDAAAPAAPAGSE